MPEKPRIAFVTIGNSPRPDIVPEMIGEALAGRSEDSIEAVEFGVLDGLDEAGLAAILARSGEEVFATRAGDGRELKIAQPRTEARLDALLGRLDGEGFDLIVLLCTGTRIRPLSRTPVIEAEKVVDHAIAALSVPGGKLGLMLPFAEQIEGFAPRHGLPEGARFAAGSPYDGSALAECAAPLAGCAVSVMHCMGYTNAMRDSLRASLPGHVLHARGLVAAALRQFL